MSTLYYKGKSYTPSEVEANPSGDPTDTLETIGIGGTVFDIASGGRGITPPKTIYKAPSYDGAALSTDVPYDNGFILDGDETLIITYCDPIDSALFGTIAIPPSLIGTPIYYTGYLRRVNYTTFGLSSFNQSISSADSEDGGYSPKVYQIDTIKTSGNFFTPQIYSTEEREIGVWIDNKPLYAKTIPLTNLSGNSASYNMAELNCETCILANGIIKLGADGANQWVTAPFLESGNYMAGIMWQNSNNYIYIKSNWGLSEAKVNVLYTKTTDTPGSGNWTSSGVPTHHYSTEEQVVGTWIDGSTIFEKTEVIDLTSSPLDGNAESTIQLSAFNSADLITDIKVVGKYKGDKATPDDYYNVIIPYTGGVKTIIDSGRELVSYGNDELTIYMGNNYKNWGASGDNRIYILYVTMQYTKTT